MDIAAQAAAMKSKGLDVVTLAAGEPDFNTPVEIQNAATQAMKDGITKYTPSSGFLKVREAIAEKVSRQNGFPVDPSEVLVTCGAKMGLYLALQCLVDPGDSVLVPTPSWVSYRSMIELSGGQMIPLPCLEQDGFGLNLERWRDLAIPSNARGILVNSPNNPTGMTYSREQLKLLTNWALQRGLWILSDEIYEHTLYDGAEHVSIASFGPEAKSHTITVSGLSKSHCMTGWRLGWAIAPKDLIQKMSALQSQSISHVTSFVQWAAMTALSMPASTIQKMNTEFDERRHYCMKRLDGMTQWLSYTRPNGAFYLFVNFSRFLTKVKMTDVELCRELLQKKYLATVPGSSFGQENFLRLSYANSIPNLEKAFDRIESFIDEMVG